ncbi:acyltransferase [uncultured Clostridium sp.]|uniref:acyltransferase family protein n=1 Tax=uncultured Clostridium sp. TaxID=59620 RepID=UPI00267332F8|nr:acyltransferase [uncultured Clostridium sp.]
MIKSLQGLRVISMLIIFMWHCGYSNFKAGIPVTFFFILSGFLSYITYKDKKEESIVIASIDYCKIKLKRIYPIHLITFLISVPLRIKIILNNFGKEIIVMITHLLLIQSIIPITHFYFNYNESAWYVSTLMFCYLFTQILVKIINKIQNMNKKLFKSIFLLLVTLVVQTVLYKVFNNTKLSQWFLYISPFYRILDYFMGMLVGFIWINTRKDINFNKNIMTIFEIFILSVISINYIPSINIYCEVNKALLLVGVFVFSLEGGLLSKILSNRIFIYFADFSFEFFLVHMPIIIICGKVSEILGVRTLIGRGATVSISFIITVVLAKILNNYVTKKKYKTSREILMT